MNIMKLKTAASKAAATVAVAVMSAPAWADGTPLEAAQNEIGSLKTGIAALGGVILGVAVAIVTIGVIKRAVSKA
ncbi:major capsid protein [Neisseria uirgultaei]|uniref:major capsid protein n=1 Tax=Neisseria uirgultaei TaxID=2830646 RepID=UPI0026597338|nr:major capsid protein [Neisseria uirgultaei]